VVVSRVVRAAVVRVVEGQVRRIHGGLPLDEPPGRGGEGEGFAGSNRAGRRIAIATRGSVLGFDEEEEEEARIACSVGCWWDACGGSCACALLALPSRQRRPAAACTRGAAARGGAGLPAVGESLSLDGSVRGVGDVPLCGLIGKAGAI
jgi:hypothetical protein